MRMMNSRQNVPYFLNGGRKTIWMRNALPWLEGFFLLTLKKPGFLVDNDSYLNSLETMRQLDVEILCTGHNFVLTGSEANEHILKSIRLAGNYLFMV
jgi:hypothetical protein